MSLPGIFGTRPGIYGIGVLAVGVIAIASLFVITSGGKHPLALESEIRLCELLDENVWLELQYPASGIIARVPEKPYDDPAVCVLELDPVPAADRWARVARGDDADKVRRIATATITSTAILRGFSPEANTRNYGATFDKELLASGWNGQNIEGPWSWASFYAKPDIESATEVGALVEDDGVVLWVVATGVAPENMITFVHKATLNIRHNAQADS